MRADDIISFTKTSRIGIGIVADTAITVDIFIVATSCDDRDYNKRARTCSIYVFAPESP